MEGKNTVRGELHSYDLAMEYLKKLGWVGPFSPTRLLENFFYWWGCKVARNPYKVVLASLLMVGLCALGLLNFKSEADAWKLYLPDGSHHSTVQSWKEAHFAEDVRGTITLFHHEANILTPEGLLLLLDLHQEVNAVKYDGRDYSHACLKIPITNIGLADKRKRKRRHASDIRPESLRAYEVRPVKDDNYSQYEDYFNFYGTEETLNGKDDEDEDEDDELDNLPKEVYCDIVETLEDKCGEYSLLEIWKYDRNIISHLTEQDILNAINTIKESPVFGYKTNYSTYLGQVEYNETGHIAKAKSVRSIWLEEFDPENIVASGALKGFESDQADPFTIGYENNVLELMQAWRAQLTKDSKGYSLFMNLGISFNQEANAPLEYDIDRQIYGYVIMFSYTILTLGKLNIVETRLYLAVAGILSVFLGFISGIGITLAMGYPYTPVSSILPFICLGIGIDDMFVIMRCFNNIPDTEKITNGPVKSMGQTLKNAGASITLTSVTDMCAFGIGALTTFPALRSLSITAAFSIMAIYLLQTSWFVAWMVIDQCRIEQKRNGILPFKVHKDWKPPKWQEHDIGTIIMQNVSKLFDFKFFQGAIILMTMTMFGIGIWGACNIQVKYDIMRFVPKDSYLKKWIDQNAIDFPSDGWGANIYSQDISYTLDDFEKIEMIVKELDNLTKVHNNWVHYGKKLPKTLQLPLEVATGFWWQDLKEFIATYKPVKNWREAFIIGKFPKYLSDFLHHKDGSIYKRYFQFSEELFCNRVAPPITAVRLGSLKFRDLQGPSQHLPAQQAVNEVLKRANLSNTTFAYGLIYPAWEIEEIIPGELYQNLSLVLVIVLLVVFVTMANFRTCSLILSCVLFTMVDVIGVTYLLNMTICPCYIVNTIICVGISVDYAAHIAHSCSTSKGSKIQCVKRGFTYISPAVVHGGMTTFLALILLVFSQSHIFQYFFAIISLTVAFGLFHGLFFLPVMIAVIGTGSNDQDEIGNETNMVDTHKEEISKNGVDNPHFEAELHIIG